MSKKILLVLVKEGIPLTEVYERVKDAGVLVGYDIVEVETQMQVCKVVQSASAVILPNENKLLQKGLDQLGCPYCVYGKGVCPKEHTIEALLSHLRLSVQNGTNN